MKNGSTSFGKPIEMGDQFRRDNLDPMGEVSIAYRLKISAFLSSFVRLRPDFRPLYFDGCGSLNRFSIARS